MPSPPKPPVFFLASGRGIKVAALIAVLRVYAGPSSVLAARSVAVSKDDNGVVAIVISPL